MATNKLNIALIGYGKMGKTIEKVAKERGHHIVAIVNSDGPTRIEQLPDNIHIAIEFSVPDAAYMNLKALAKKSIPTVCGTTGWLDNYEEISNDYAEAKSSFLYASNFSIGVNLFFAVNQHLAKIMGTQMDYNVSITESHHVTKLDAPSGTAITLAEQVIDNHPVKTTWKREIDPDINTNSISIKSIREADVKGMHEIIYNSEVDAITIKHEAFTRKGFALGAVLAAEFIANKQGVFQMSDVLNI